MRPTFLPRIVLILSALLFGITASAKEPFFEGLGSYKRKITTDSPEAQRYFNQGLAFLHGFNHGAAIRDEDRQEEPTQVFHRSRSRTIDNCQRVNHRDRFGAG